MFLPPDGPDFAIPDGHFFTQALPDRTDGGGFAVEDGHGADLWSAFKSAGGVDALGYPISRRFEWSGDVAQAFVYGVLRWNRSSGAAKRAASPTCPAAESPRYAIQPEQPPRRSRRGPASRLVRLVVAGLQRSRTNAVRDRRTARQVRPVHAGAARRGPRHPRMRAQRPSSSRTPPGPATATALPRPRCWSQSH